MLRREQRVLLEIYPILEYYKRDLMCITSKSWITALLYILQVSFIVFLHRFQTPLNFVVQWYILPMYQPWLLVLCKDTARADAKSYWNTSTRAMTKNSGIISKPSGWCRRTSAQQHLLYFLSILLLNNPISILLPRHHHHFYPVYHLEHCDRNNIYS